MAKKLWGGRFKKKTNPLVEDFTKSIDYDYKLAKADIIGSQIHVSILEKSGFLTHEEKEKLMKGLDIVYNELKSGEFVFDRECEDIHTNIQNALEEHIGDLVLKLHTARSRNDQVLFDLKLFSKNELLAITSLCADLKKALNTACVKAKGIIIPGYTHLQRAQLIYLTDHLKSYVEMLDRDYNRLIEIGTRIKLSLGAGALAGTPIKADIYSKLIQEFIKEQKKFAAILNIKSDVTTPKALDTVSDRDFVIEILSALAIVGMHLSRFAEDLIIWSTKEFNFVQLDDAFATGSSLMPQKKNPDVLELVRGYTGILYGNLVSALTMMKGLPLTYNRDMQLDKPPLFSSFEIIAKELKVMAALVATLEWNTGVIQKSIEEDEGIYATDLAYYLIGKGIPFSRAHEIIGRLMSYSLESQKKIRQMKDEELKTFSEALKHTEIVKLMDPVISVKSRVSVER
ncbi:MAG: argininosuccinate lyase [Candidatus Omnitrophica bacterium]|nr:argininosuccinate lyase [Candidatus Omnitrophota bacterium]